MKKTPVVIASLVLAGAVAIGYHLYLQQPAMAATQPAATAPGNPDELQYPNGAAQLAMISAQVLPSVAVPAGDALSARVVYDEDVTARLGASVAGRVMAIKAAPGDKVHAGQVLAEIDSPDFGAALADLGKAQADEERKRQVFERAKELGPGEAVAAKDWEAAQADYLQARAETVRAAQRVKNINPHGLHLPGQRFAVASPMDGVVAERAVTPSLDVGPGMASPMFVVTNPRRLWLLIDVPESMLSSVTLGTGVDVESDAFPGEHFKAEITQLGQTVDPNTRRVVVRARLDNPAGKLLPEMFVRSTLLHAQGSAVKVPNSALVNRGLYNYVFVQTGAGHFQRRQVKMLTHGGDASYLGEGVKGGENIVISGALLLDAEMGTRAGGAP
ncbi:efflux RND transporter periplasmic adaptor subunit [Duganella sp. FT135W]|uniref:Efflux RND transporter periplasmic adaptor subunit n=2 Tax=Duganella flavida TaxID=2692175 RepID=A0A6L8KFB4_9BURK|nr:efflux RND transporter periplasmic adaptor subunit [Duganella flavida]